MDGVTNKHEGEVNIGNEAIEATVAYCDEAVRMCSTDPNQEGYDQGFDDAIRGMAAKVKRLLNREVQ